MRKVVTVTIVVGLLGAAGVAAAVLLGPGQALARERRADGEELRVLPGFFDELLDELVADGTITQTQADAIVAAAIEKATEEREARLEHRDLLRELFEDGVITSEEAALLDDNAWLLSDEFDAAWEDGELTRDEIAEVQRELRPMRPLHFPLWRNGDH